VYIHPTKRTLGILRTLNQPYGHGGEHHQVPAVSTTSWAIGSTLPESSTLVPETISPVSHSPLPHMGQLRLTPWSRSILGACGLARGLAAQ
jgi:hypothetical protein